MDESQLQVRPKDRGSALSLSKAPSSLIARGRRDAEAIAMRVDPLLETRRLAEQGRADALLHLGNAYYYGEGVPQDYGESVRWYRKAAEQGDPDDPDDPERLGAYYEARQILAAFFPRDYVEVESQAAERGRAEAQYGLAWAYRRGELVLQDYAKAAKWFSEAAEQGHADAQYELGIAYYSGQGASGDYAEAAKWFREAAGRGHAGAQYHLSKAYYWGEGVAQDYTQAANWWNKAAEQGHATAQCIRGILCYEEAHDYAEAAEWFRKAAEQGDAAAQYSLGVIYHRGEGVAPDYAEAAKWLGKAANQGHADAQHYLRDVYDHGEGAAG